MEIVHIQTGNKKLFKPQEGNDLQGPINYRPRIEDATSNIMAKGDGFTDRRKMNVAVVAVMIPECRRTYFWAIDFEGRIFDYGELALHASQREPVNYFRHAVDRSEQD
ncbi:hypothetical protein D3C81_1832270 [compost metagenome]